MLFLQVAVPMTCFRELLVVERQVRGNCSELSCMEVGVGPMRNLLIQNLRVCLIDQISDGPWLSVWIEYPCVCFEGTQHTPEVMLGS